MSSRRAWIEPLAVFTGCLTLAALLSSRLFATPGWVGMHHDWSPAPFPGQIAAWASDEFYGWFQLGPGFPSNYPNDWVILWIYSLIARIVDAPLLSKFTLLAVPAIAAFSTYLLTRKDLKLPLFPCCVAAFFAATNPVLFNKIIAGQLAYLWGYALFPLWLTAYRIEAARTSRTWQLRILAGVIAAVISSQIQFIVFMALTMIVDGLVTRRRLRFDIALAPVATIVCVALAQAATVVSVSQSIGYLSHSVVDVPSLDWIRLNSATLLEAFALRGYVTHYFANMYGLLPTIGGLLVPIGLVFSAFLVYGAIVTWRHPRARLFPLMWILGVYAMAGVNAPGSAFVAALYSHVREMQMFREVYHWAVLTELGGAILFAYAIASLRTLPRVGIAAVGLALADLLLYFAPAFTGNWSGQMQVVQTSPLLRAYYEQLAHAPYDARVMWLPIDQPMSPPGGTFAGLDPMANTRPPSLWEYVLAPPVSTITLGLRSNDTAGLDRLLEYSAVSTIALRKGFVSHIPDFAYRHSPQLVQTYASGATERGLRSLGWTLTQDDAAVTAYTAPQRNTILASARGFALVPPIARLLPLVPRGLSPVGAEIPDTIDEAVIEEPDVDTMIALASPQRRNLLDAGIILDSADALISWAPIDAWWYYRYALTEVLDTSMISLGQTLDPGRELILGPVAAHTRVVVSFVASPNGGTLQIQTPDGRYLEYDTHARSASLRSVTLALRAEGQLTIRNLSGEQAIRRAFVLSAEDWTGATRRFKSILARTPNVTILPEGSKAFFAPSTGMYALHGVASIDGKAVVGQVYLHDGNHTVVANDLATIVFGHNHATVPAPLQNTAETLDGNRFSGIAPPGTSVLRLRMSYSPGWQLEMPNATEIKHLPGDFFMNAWSFPPARVATPFTIVYRDGMHIAELHRLAQVGLVALVLIALLLPLAHRIRSAPQR